MREESEWQEEREWKKIIIQKLFLALYLKKYKLNISQKKEESVFISKCLTDYVLYLFENENNTQEEIVEKIATFLSEDIVLNITKSYISSLKYKK